MRADDLARRLSSRTEAMLADLERVVSAESPTEDRGALAACAEVVAELGARLLGDEPRPETRDGYPHLRWRLDGPVGASTRVALLAHLDTVWPVGTVDRWPFAVADGRATGPGVFDMKAGLVQGLHAAATLREDGEPPAALELLVTADEEIGSPTSRELVEETARDADAVLVLEPSADGALKLARKGVGRYRVGIAGRAAHAGLEPEDGVNAIEELVEQVRRLADLADHGAGTTVTPTLASAGTAVNVVPAEAVLEIDVRAATVAELERVDDGLRGLRPGLTGAAVTVDGGINRPPLEPETSAELFARAQRIAARLGTGPLQGATVGGGSDGNFAAAAGTPTLDGLGAVGGGAHAEGEHVEVDAMWERAALVAGLVEDLGSRRPG